MTAGSEYIVSRERWWLVAWMALLIPQGVLVVAIALVKRPNPYTPEVMILSLVIAAPFVLILLITFVVKRSRLFPAEQAARRLGGGLSFVTIPSPGLMGQLDGFAATASPPRRPYPVLVDDAGIRFATLDGGAPFAMIPWEAIQRIDGGDALRIVLDEDSHLLLQPMGIAAPLGRRRVRALAERLRTVAG